MFVHWILSPRFGIFPAIFDPLLPRVVHRLIIHNLVCGTLLNGFKCVVVDAFHSVSQSTEITTSIHGIKTSNQWAEFSKIFSTALNQAMKTLIPFLGFIVLISTVSSMHVNNCDMICAMNPSQSSEPLSPNPDLCCRKNNYGGGLCRNKRAFCYIRQKTFEDEEWFSTNCHNFHCIGYEIIKY